MTIATHRVYSISIFALAVPCVIALTRGMKCQSVSHLVDIRMVYFREEAHFRRGHWVVLRQEELQLEHSPMVRRIDRTHYNDVEVALILLGRTRTDARRRVCHQPLRLLYDMYAPRQIPIHIRREREHMCRHQDCVSFRPLPTYEHDVYA